LSLRVIAPVAVIPDFVAAEEAEAGMAEMSKLYDETGRELYMGAGDREHD
jgi:phosphomethylpyrimidine synthase